MNTYAPTLIDVVACIVCVTIQVWDKSIIIFYMYVSGCLPTTVSSTCGPCAPGSSPTDIKCHALVLTTIV